MTCVGRLEGTGPDGRDRFRRRTGVRRRPLQRTGGVPERSYESRLWYFEPGQFIPVHAPDSDVAITIRSGTGLVRDGGVDHAVGPGDVVVVAAGTDRGVKADEDTPLEGLLVSAPPPTDAEHEPVREGIRRNEFEP